tara:strand:- start:3745 stop:4749 length:1005 start_codon:yes stop_codon:yes gene_type:complete
MILVTGSAGFIGSHVCIKLLENGHSVIGVDNLNDYYDVSIKKARLKRFLNNSNYKHFKIDISNKLMLSKIFSKYEIKRVINLAAQAGVRYSIENPEAYIKSNIEGFMNILENCRHNRVEHLVYASTSSVYGANTSMPFSENNSANHQLSIYAATKKSNEIMAHTYSHLYNIPTTGLRFFTVYGPWGRPDMALFKFTKSIINNEPIEVFNNGNHTRDFTYIDDITEGIIKILSKIPEPNSEWTSSDPDPASSNCPWRIYNIGNNNPVQLLEYIDALQKALNKKAKKNFLPLQLGDVPNTFANIDNLKNQVNFHPSTSVQDGISNFVKWYKQYYKI